MVFHARVKELVDTLVLGADEQGAKVRRAGGTSQVSPLLKTCFERIGDEGADHGQVLSRVPVKITDLWSVIFYAKVLFWTW